jgi:hypothetical protein
MAEPGVRFANSLGVFLSLRLELGFCSIGTIQPLEEKIRPECLRRAGPGLGHAASACRQRKLSRPDKPAACYVLEPRPKAVADENDGNSRTHIKLF